MKKIIIGLIILQLSSNLCASPLQLDQYFRFTDEFKKFSFEVHSVQINELVKQKLLLKQSPKLAAQVSYANDKIDLKLLNAEIVPEVSRMRIYQSFLRKAKIVTGAEIAPWVKDYTYQKSKNINKHLYVDESGLLDRSEIIIEEKAKELIVTEIYPTGKIISKYYYYLPVWSRGKKVISKIKRISDTENEEQEVISYISYEKLSNRAWFPSNLTIETTQVLNPKTENEVTRKIEEKIIFSNYKF